MRDNVLPKLPSVTGAVSKVAEDRLASVQKSVSQTINPVRQLSRAVAIISSKLLSNELSGELNPTLSFFSDIKDELRKSIKVSSNNSEKEQSKIKLVADKQDQSNDVLQSAVSWLTKIHDAITIQTDRLELELKTLIDVTSQVWDLSKLQVDATRGLLQFQRDMDRKRLFDQQKANDDIAKKDITPIVQEKKQETFIDKILGFFPFLGRLFAGGLGELLLALTGAAFLPKMAGILSFAFKTLIRLPVIVGFFGGLFEAAQGTIQKFLAGDTWTNIVTGFFTDFTKGFIDILTSSVNALFGTNLYSGEKTFDIATDYVGQAYAAAYTFLDSTFTDINNIFNSSTGALLGVSDTFINTIFSIPENLYNFTGMLTDGWNSITSSIGNAYTNATNYINDKTISFLEMFDPLTSAISSFTTSLTDGWNNIKDVFTSSIKSFINYAVDILPFGLGESLKENLPSSVQSFMNEPETRLTPRQSNSVAMTERIMSGQDAIKNSEYEKIMYEEAFHKGSSIINHNVPVVTNVNNAAILTSPIITRNPDVPVIIGRNYF